MKKVLLVAAVLCFFGFKTEVSAQNRKNLKASERGVDTKTVRLKKQTPVNVSYDSSTTVLTVNFPQNSNGGTVEVFRDGVKVSAMTAGGGTTFSCMLDDYGEGEYDIIVNRGNTVLYSKNVSIR